MRKKIRRRGLILLIALGMLAMFSLLAVTYVVTTGSSKNSSVAMVARARTGNITIDGTTNSVASMLIRGTNDQSSALYKHSLLEDIFSPNPLRSRFGNTSQGAVAFQSDWCRLVSPTSPFISSAGPNFIKVSLLNSDVVNGPLSDFENEYNSRLLTVLEGPLAGQTFRILKYVGYVRSNLSGAKPDPNIASIGTWSNSNYQDSDWYRTEYSVLIDLSEARGTLFTGQFINGSGRAETISRSIADWVADVTHGGVSSLFFLKNGPSYNGYSFLINDVAFNNAGIGMSDVAGKPAPPTIPPTVPPNFQGFGTLDGREFMKQSLTGKPSIPPAYLPNYDYLSNPQLMQLPVNGIGISQRTNSLQNLLNGASNEGYDVADWRDFWLAHLSYVSGNPVPNIIPSFHRPELVNYISNVFAAPSSMNATDVEDMVRLIDASTARVLRYRLSGTAFANTNFRSNVDPNPPLTSVPWGTFSWSSPPTAGEILFLRNWVARQITGPWDVDNDRDGIPDSVYINPGLPASYSPDGRMLRPLASLMIQDLDSRININTAGDRTQGLTGFDLSPNPFVHKKSAAGVTTSQGFGYGPAEISLTSLFGGELSLLRSNASSFSLFDDRYGARRYVRRPIDYTEYAMDRVPGRRSLILQNPAFGANDNFSQYMEREIHDPLLVTTPTGRRSSLATEIDRNGNLSFVQQNSADADPYNPAILARPSEINDDPYEMAALEKSNADDPFGLADLAAVLLRYEGDSSSLPKRLRERLAQMPGYSDMSAVNGLITTRSAELRYPNLVAAQNTRVGTEDWIDHQATSLHRWIYMLHKQRYQRAGEQDLSRRSIEELFSTDFSKGLRMDLNRPFGNGFDDDADGQIDDPEEIEFVSQFERFSRQDGTQIPNTNGLYFRELQTSMGGSGVGSRGRLASRQIFARNLYCLAQLIVPRDFRFTGMADVTLTEVNARIRAAALAQWAVNVVDFRDSDAVMTRFEYDISPFGNAALGALPARDAYWAPDHLEQATSKNFVGVVWGLEMPELLLTETLALHDKGQRDTDVEAPMGNVYHPTDTNLDPDLDQYRFPLASLFLELYATRSADTAVSSLPSNIALPGTAVDPQTVNSFSNREGMYVNHLGQVKLDLERLAPLNGTWGRQPVWRMAVTEYNVTQPRDFVTTPSTLENITHQSSTPTSIAGVNWPATSNSPDDVTGSGLPFDVRDPDGSDTDPTRKPIAFDRIIWFSSTAPGATQNIPDLKNTIAATDREHTVYYNRSGTPAYLAGGNFMVVGPRANTPVGSSTHSGAVAWNPILLRSEVTTAKPTYTPSSQRIDLSGGTVQTRLLNNTLANESWTNLANGRIKSPVSIFCGANPPSDPLWATAFPNGIGINVSLPNPIVTGNPIWSTTNAPTSRIDTTFPLLDSWIDASSNSVVGTVKDHPFDDTPPTGVVANTEIAKLLDAKPLGTYEAIKSVYLQRLADPDIGYDPVSNPYITVDWMAVDLTVFNGEAPVDTAIPPPKPTRFQSRYKNGSYAQGTTSNSDGSTTGASYLSPITGSFSDSLPQPNPDTQYRSYFQHQLGYRTPLANWTGFLGNSGTTLGYGNAGFVPGGTYLTLAQMSIANGSGVTPVMDGFGPPTSTNDAGNAVSAAYVGATRNLTSIPWFNRPFATPYELRLVPIVGPGQIGYFHSTGISAKKPFAFLPQFGTANAINTEEGAPNRSYWLNPSSDLSSPPHLVETDMHLLMELVETQPPFADSARVIQPDIIASMVTAAAAVNDNVALRFLNSSVPANYYGTGVPILVRGTGLLPPNNTLPSFVTAGKINLNTMGEDSAGNAPALKAIENNFLPPGSRTNAVDPIQTQFMDSRRGFALPTSWTSSFFTAAPSYTAAFPPSDANYPTQFAGAYRPASSANLVPHVEDSVARQKMRGKFNVETTLARSLALAPNSIYTNPVTPADVNTYNNAAPMFSTTTEANAFGYHQRNMRLPNLISNQSNLFAVWITVSLYEYDPIQGFGNEYVDERGEPKMERMFYIIDRTIPVGFKPGENLNTDRTILYQRKLN